MRITKGWAVLCVLPLAGCGQELKTADYLYPSQNALIRKHLVEEDSYVVTHSAWKDRTLTLQYYSVFSGQIIPPLARVTVLFKDTEIMDLRPGGTERLPVIIDASKDFPSGSKQKIVSTGETYTVNGTELSPCIRTKGDDKESVYCTGVGQVWSKEISLTGKTSTMEVTTVKRFAAQDRVAELSGLTILLDDSAEKTLPAEEQASYKTWVNKVCHTQVDGHGVELGFVTSSLACGCLYNADKESVESILLDPTSLIPLGTGTGAQEFYGKTLDCVREATGFKGPLS